MRKFGFLAFAAALSAALGASAIERHDDSYVRNGVTYAQRGGMSAETYVVTNVDMTADDVGAVGRDETWESVSNKAITAIQTLEPATNYTDEAIAALKKVDGAARALPPYLHYMPFDDVYTNDAAWYYEQAATNYVHGSCSARRVGGILERNYDWEFDRAPEFVIPLSGSDTRFASVGIANVGRLLTEDFVTSGKWSRHYRCLPGHTLDGINENGVVAEINVVGGVPSGWGSTGDIHPLGAVRWALDNGTSAGMAASNLAVRVKFPAGWSQNFHYMIADSVQTWIVENGAAHLVGNASVSAVMTNFRLYPTHDTEGEGQERYAILSNPANAITDAWFTRCYKRETTPPWTSDLTGLLAYTNAIYDDWATHDREFFRDMAIDGKRWWQTVHSTSYDFTNLTLRVAVQETDEWYVFAVPSAGGVKPDAVKEIVEPMLVSATNGLRGKTDFDIAGEVTGYDIFKGLDKWPCDLKVSATKWVGNTNPVINNQRGVIEFNSSGVGVHAYREWFNGDEWEIDVDFGSNATAKPTDATFDTYGGDYDTTVTTRFSAAQKLARTSHLNAGGIAKFGAGGVMEQATPSSTGGAEADFRDPADNTCHETWYIYGDWTYDKSGVGIHWDDVFVGWMPYPDGNYKGNKDSTELHWEADEWPGGFAFTATRTRHRVATKDDTFVTHSFVTNEVAAKQDALPYPTNAIPTAAIDDFADEVARLAPAPGNYASVSNAAMNARHMTNLVYSTSYDTWTWELSEGYEPAAEARAKLNATHPRWNDEEEKWEADEFETSDQRWVPNFWIEQDKDADEVLVNYDVYIEEETIRTSDITFLRTRHLKVDRLALMSDLNANSLRTMLVDANTNTTADCECISTNLCKIIKPHIKAVNVVAEHYDATLEALWSVYITDGDMKFSVRTNEDTTAFREANAVLTDETTEKKYRVGIDDGEMKLFTNEFGNPQ